MSETETYETIHHWATGGTADSHWDPAEDTAVPNATTVIPNYLNNVARLRNEVRSTQLFMKDSRRVSVQDRQLTANKILESKDRLHLGTSGTFTMDVLARTILQHPLYNRMISPQLAARV